MPIQQRSQLKGFGQSTNEKYIVEDINDLVEFANNPQGGTNPTSGIMPYNNGGVFADSPFGYNSSPTPTIFTQIAAPFGLSPSFADYGLMITSNSFKLGVFNGFVPISSSIHFGLQMDYSSYSSNFSFGRSYSFDPYGNNSGGNLEGFVSQYNGYSGMGAGDSSLMVNSQGQLVLNGSLSGWYDPSGYSGPVYYNYIPVRIGMSIYRIPLYS